MKRSLGLLLAAALLAGLLTACSKEEKGAGKHKLRRICYR